MVNCLKNWYFFNLVFLYKGIIVFFLYIEIFLLVLKKKLNWFCVWFEYICEECYVNRSVFVKIVNILNRLV